MSASLAQRFPNLGKLSIALLEHIVEPILGEKAIKEIKSPVAEQELQEALANALNITEKRFVSEYSDQRISEAILNLPLANLPSFLESVRSFYNRPTDSSLANTLQTQLESIIPNALKKQIKPVISNYLRILREELINLPGDIRNKLQAIATLGILDNTARITDALERMEQHIKTTEKASYSSISSYFEQIAKLLNNTASNVDQKTLASNLTLSTLAVANQEQKKSIIRFLYESNLIVYPSLISLFRADLQGVDLSETDLSNVDFHGANLQNANFIRTNLSNAILVGTILSNADLTEAILQNSILGAAILHETNLSYADLSYANLGPFWETSGGGADCKSAKLIKTKLIEADLTGASFKQAKLNGADLSLSIFGNEKYYFYTTDFSDADLRDANLRGAQIETNETTGALFVRADLRGANLIGASLGAGTSISHAIIDNTTLLEDKWRIMWGIVNNDSSAKDLGGLDLSYLDLRECNLESANLCGTNLRGTNLGNSSLFQARIDEKTFLEKKWRTVWELVNLGGINRDLSFSDLSYANLDNANLFDANLHGANLQYSNLSGTNLLNANLRESNLFRAQISPFTKLDPKWSLVWKIVNEGVAESILDGVDLSEALLTNANMYKSSLKNSVLINTILRRANLEQAVLDYSQLIDTDLQDAKLGWSSMIKVTITGADLSSCDLRFARLTSANLQDVSLDKAQMRAVNLTLATLKDVSLVGADLKYAKLNETNLSNVDFTDAELENTELHGAKFNSSTIWPDKFDPKKFGASEI